MKVEIWSDILCPFCYIGKRKFEAALANFPQKDEVEIEWKSFQLSPNMISDSKKSIHQFLAEHKGVSLAEARKMNEKMAAIALKVGLNYNFDISKVVNSFEAHRFLHFAKEKGLQNEVKEKLLAAYFIEGKNIGDYQTLLNIGKEIGFDDTETNIFLESNKYADEVEKDIDEAYQIGLTGVPFFVFDRKFAISGAQEVDVFLEALYEAVKQ